MTGPRRSSVSRPVRHLKTSLNRPVRLAQTAGTTRATAISEQETRVSNPTQAPGQQPPQGNPATREAARLLGEAIAQVQRVIVGQEHMVEQLMVGLLAKGHVLLEGVPGVAKTLAVRSFATVVGGDFSRIQFTPDLVPSDIVGTRIYSAQQEKFDIALGPVFVNFVLADEINRAPAKVQSAMLELMAERQVSIGGHHLPGAEAVHRDRHPEPDRVRGRLSAARGAAGPLPAQGGRAYPRGNEEFEILRRMSVSPPTVQRAEPAQIKELQNQAVRRVRAQPRRRVHRATGAGHPHPGRVRHARPDRGDPDRLLPRATLGLVAASRALALIHGRDYVLPTDVQAVAKDVMSHRLVLGFDAVADNITPAQVVERIVAMVPPPTPVWNQQQRDQSHTQHRHNPSYSN